MKILVIGGGGREDAIIQKLAEDERAETIYALPGNGGIAARAQCVPVAATDIPHIIDFAWEHAVDFAVVAPDDPLALGAVDELEKLGVPCFGPRKNAALIESSKSFAKDLMAKYGIPTAAYRTFSALDSALAYVETCPLPAVVKADGLALGKGVRICETREEAKGAVQAMMAEKIFGESGARIVIEEYLDGPEVSVLAFTDGETIVPMVSSMDHKRALDGDKGLNTGGMGTIAPNPFYTADIAERCQREIFVPTVQAMKAEGRPFKGCLYFGLMLTEQGPKVIEYNCRFGDPETQVILPLLEGSLLEIMLATAQGRLQDVPVRFRDGCACCVVLASQGYPASYKTGFPITLPETGEYERIYIAGAAQENGKKNRQENGQLVTKGGRVLGAVGLGDTLAQAVSRAYGLAGRIHFDNAYYRQDIGKRALAAEGQD